MKCEGEDYQFFLVRQEHNPLLYQNIWVFLKKNKEFIETGKHTMKF